MDDNSKAQESLTSTNLTRRELLRWSAAAGLSATAFGGLVAQSASAAAQSGENNSYPAYYPNSYGDIVDAANDEGTLNIYSVMTAYNWQPVIDGFNKLYPGITVTTNNLGPSAVFERYRSERATGQATADMLVTLAPKLWHELSADNLVLKYKSPESPKVPEWTRRMSGVYAFSTDPLIMLTNKLKLDKSERPKGIRELASMVSKSPSRFDGKIGGYDPTGADLFAASWYEYTREVDDAWKSLETILPQAKLGVSTGTMVQKLRSSEYLVAMAASATTALPLLEEGGHLVLDWSYIAEGTPLWLRNMAITKTAEHPAAAKLMLDYILSHDGQIAISKGGFTPYRPDMQSAVDRGYDTLVAEVGEENIILVDGASSEEKMQEFLAKWQSAVKG